MASRESPPADSWRGRARRFARERVAPLAAEIDRSDRVPPELFRSLAEAGLSGLGLPTAWGGQGGTPADVAAALEELARASAAVATDLSVHLSVCAAPIARWGNDAQRQRYLRPLAEGTFLGAFALSEPGIGSDAAHLTTRYERSPRGFSLTGSKMFITNGASADVVLAFASRDPAIGARAISAFLVPKGARGYSVAQRLDKLGLRGSETTELVFDRTELGPDALLGEEGAGLSLALETLTGGRVGIAACALGVAEAAFDELRDAARERPDGGEGGGLGRAYVRLEAARALVDEAARRQTAGAAYDRAASVAKLSASEAAAEIAQAAVEARGMAGARSGDLAERLLRDARVFPIVEGTSEIQLRILGRALLSEGAPKSGAAGRR